jgi:hypothetical protein
LGQPAPLVSDEQVLSIHPHELAASVCGIVLLCSVQAGLSQQDLWLMHRSLMP